MSLSQGGPWTRILEEEMELPRTQMAEDPVQCVRQKMTIRSNGFVTANFMIFIGVSCVRIDRILSIIIPVALLPQFRNPMQRSSPKT